MPWVTTVDYQLQYHSSRIPKTCCKYYHQNLTYCSSIISRAAHVVEKYILQSPLFCCQQMYLGIERMYILGHRLSIVIWVYFKPGNIDLVRITNYIRIFCMSHCVSYMYKYTGKYLFPTLSDLGILSYLLIPIAFQIFVLDASGQSHLQVCLQIPVLQVLPSSTYDCLLILVNCSCCLQVLLG